MKSMSESRLLDTYNPHQQILNRGNRPEISRKEKKVKLVSNSYFQDVKLGTLKYLPLIVPISLI